MKNVLLLLLLLFPLFVFTQNDTIKSNNKNWTESKLSVKNALEKKDNIIKTSILPYLWGEVNLSFEKKTSNRTSCKIGIASLLYNTFVPLRTDTGHITTFFISSDFRVYLGWKKANRGFYIAPNINRRYTSLKRQGHLKEAHITLGAGLLFGNQWIANSFVYDLNIGVIVYEELMKDQPNPSSILPHLAFSIGYAF